MNTGRSPPIVTFPMRSGLRFMNGANLASRVVEVNHPGGPFLRAGERVVRLNRWSNSRG